MCLDGDKSIKDIKLLQISDLHWQVRPNNAWSIDHENFKKLVVFIYSCVLDRKTFVSATQLCMYVCLYVFSDIDSITCPRWTRESSARHSRTCKFEVDFADFELSSQCQVRRRTSYFREWSIKHRGNGKFRFFVLANVILGEDHFSIPKWSNKRPFRATLAEVMWERSKRRNRIMAVNIIWASFQPSVCFWRRLCAFSRQ